MKIAIELLAPAGGLDAACAALHYGADAIYLGLEKFSARAGAENFTLEQVSEITGFAHALARRRRVLVTVNTLVLRRELPELIAVLGALSDIGVDALIIQDLGVYAIVRKHFPEFELHASTQMAVHNRAGVETLRQLGFKRVILARELTLEEVRGISAGAGIETEVFIHGALCYAYSGLCLLSAQSTGRSGNRGQCAYACRDEFTVSGAPVALRGGARTKCDPSRGFAFSMKDLALPDYLAALRAAGVAGFKIEGRKKSALYVATATAYYRKLLDGQFASAAARAEHEADMKTVFSRPWTRLFIQSHRDKEVADRDTVGHRGNPLGVVAAVVRGRSGPEFLRLRIARAIERHDGLQIDVPGLGKPFGFAVDTLRIVDAGSAGFQPANEGGQDGRAPRKNVFAAPAGATIEVALPDEHPALPLGAVVYCASSQAVKRRYRHTRPKPGQFRVRRPVDFAVTLTENELAAEARLPARHPHEETIVTRQALAGPFIRAQDVVKLAAAMRGAFEKLGETSFTPGLFSFENPAALFVPVSQLNQFRRKLTGALQANLDAARAQRILGAQASSPPEGGQDARAPSTDAARMAALPAFRWSLKVDRVKFLAAFTSDDWREIDEIVIEIARDPLPVLTEKLAALAGQTRRGAIRLALPVLTRKWEEPAIRAKIEHLRAAGWTKWEAGNLSAWQFLPLSINNAVQNRQSSIVNRQSLTADWPLYAVNRAAAEQVLALGAERFTLSPEDGLDNMRALLAEFGAQATVIVHQDTPLMLSESCAYANLIGGCPGKANCRFEQMNMVSGYGEKVTALDYHCRTIVVNQGAFCLASRLPELAAAGAVSLRADFVCRGYTPEEVRQTWQLIRAGKNVPGGYVANFDRGML